MAHLAMWEVDPDHDTPEKPLGDHVTDIEYAVASASR
jgi:hypothetical protein